MKFIGNTKEYLHLQTLTADNCLILKESIESSLTILWMESGINTFKIDGRKYDFKQNQIVFLTEFHKVKVESIKKIRFLRFNRPFYCVLDHDKEVSCKGVLFFGASRLPIIQIPVDELDKFETLWKMFCIEMDSNDNLQIDMLQMMLKRYLILCTRIYKMQALNLDKKSDYDLIREFNFLVEQHFKTKHTIAEYAELLNKSPKTLSNLFSKVGAKTPLQYIHDRKMLEARRLLHHSDMQIQEIAYEIGYEDIQTFSRFFKKKEGVSPTIFRDNDDREELLNLRE
jgi:AraC-like DNA-binding protein